MVCVIVGRIRIRVSDSLAPSKVFIICSASNRDWLKPLRCSRNGCKGTGIIKSKCSSAISVSIHSRSTAPNGSAMERFLLNLNSRIASRAMPLY